MRIEWTQRLLLCYLHHPNWLLWGMLLLFSLKRKIILGENHNHDNIESDNYIPSFITFVLFWSPLGVVVLSLSITVWFANRTWTLKRLFLESKWLVCFCSSSSSSSSSPSKTCWFSPYKIECLYSARLIPRRSHLITYTIVENISYCRWTPICTWNTGKFALFRYYYQVHFRDVPKG
jgi:hypothetical protein